MFLQKRISFDKDLNEQQLRVVHSGPGPVLVIAGAGSGKTRTLTYRVAYLIESGVDPYSLLLVTFTNKAAREMLNRVEMLVPQNTKKIWGGTFHHVANRILRAHAVRLGFQPNFTILDQQDSVDLLNSCLADLGYKKRKGLMPQGSVLSHIVSLGRNTRSGLEEIISNRYPYFGEHLRELQKIYGLYCEKKMKLNLLDFDDLLENWLRLMEEDQTIKEFYSARFQQILVDEYQDTNKLQADIIDLLASSHHNLMVVGDDSQSIYSFRGANFSNIMEFPRRYPHAQMYKLEYNYRSSPEILYLANQSIIRNENQFRKILKPLRENNIQPVLVSIGTAIEQAQFVSIKINQYLSAGSSPGDIAVLYRAHYHSMELQMALTRLGVPFEIRSGIRFFEQAHIKDIASYLKILLNPFDEVAWKRILQLLPHIGKVRSQKIWKYLSSVENPLAECQDERIESSVPPAAVPYWKKLCGILASLVHMGAEASPALLIEAIFAGGYEEYMRTKYHDPSGRAEDIERFMEFACQYERLQDLLSELALLTSLSADDIRAAEETETVKLSTIHQAKGLEWPIVFILSLHEGGFPNPRNIYRKEDEEEERRLFYVAITRAKDHLYLCSPQWARGHDGSGITLKPSRFIREIPPQFFKRVYLTGGADDV